MIAGDFTFVNNIARHNLGRLMPDGSFDVSFDPGVGPNGTVRAMALQRDGRIVIGGFFSQYQATNRAHIARVYPDGTHDVTFNPGAGADNPVYALVIQPNGKILVGGAFSAFNSITRPGIVRLNTNGAVDTTFNTGAGPNNTVFAVALQSDGKVLIGGDFTAVNGVPRNRIARLNANGSVDLNFDPGAGMDSTVRTILVQPDGKIVAGGSFTSVNGTPRSFLARLNTSGGNDAGFLAPPLIGGDNSVYALGIQVDGKLLVAGDFRRFSGVTRNRLTRLNPDGSPDPTINFGSGADSFVGTLVVQPDRNIVFGGGFSQFDDQPRRHVARIYGGSVAGAGSLEFSRAEYVANENGTNAFIGVRRRGGTTGQVGVNYVTTDGTAVGLFDYLPTSGMLTFPEAETQQGFLVPIIDNSVPNVPSDRTVNLSLIGGTFTGGAAIGRQPVAVLTILDDEGSIGFSSENFNVNENAASGKAVITVVRSGATNTLATVDFFTLAGLSSATAFSDYRPTNGTLVFLPGETVKNFHVPIINDTNVEGNETVRFALANASGSNTITTGFAELLIVDDEFAPGQLTLSSFSYTNNEEQGFAVITVLRTNGTTGFVTAEYNTSDGTAIGGLDYTPTNGILTFGDGERVKTFIVPIINDLLVESTENLFVHLSTPTGGAALGTVRDATLFITDTDTNIIIAAGALLVSENFTNKNNAIDPNETVTVALFLRNIGSAATTNLVATLLPGGGVNAPSGPQSYGALVPGGQAVSNHYSFRATGSNGNRLTATLLLTESGVTNGFVNFFFTLGGQANVTVTSTNRLITINDNTIATPYPSLINVANIGGVITNMTVSINKLTHTFPADLDMLLVGPDGVTMAAIMSDAGTNKPVSNVTLTFSDSAASVIPDAAQIVSGTFRGFNYAGNNTCDIFPQPAPQPPTNGSAGCIYATNSALSVFNGTSPIGNWSLFVVDDHATDVGVITNGWSLTFQTSDPIPPASDLLVAASGSRGPVAVGQNCACLIAVTNYGPMPATNVVVTDFMPAGFALVSATTSVGTWAQTAGNVTFNIGRLAVGGSATINLVTRPISPGTHLTTVNAKSSNVDLYPANNTVTMSTLAVASPALTLVRQGHAVVVSWPAGSAFVLQASETLLPGSWTDVTAVPTTSGGVNSVTVNASTGRKFYRLRMP